MHSRLDTPLCTHTLSVVFFFFFHFFQMNSTLACTQTNNKLPCQSRMNRNDRNDSNVLHFRNCFPLTLWSPVRGHAVMWERQITNTNFDKEWRANDALLGASISITIYDKGVFMFKNDLHADLNALTRRLNRADTEFTFLCVNFMFKVFCMLVMVLFRLVP